MWNDLVIFRFKAFGYHTAIIVKIKNPIPYDMCGCINILNYETTSTVSSLNLSLNYFGADMYYVMSMYNNTTLFTQ